MNQLIKQLCEQSHTYAYDQIHRIPISKYDYSEIYNTKLVELVCQECCKIAESYPELVVDEIVEDIKKLYKTKM
jgi:hypothetical protein